MRTPIFKGAGVAIITPFDNNGIDYNQFEKLIESQIKGGIDAIIVCGTTGEASTMPDKEHKAAVSFVVEKVNKRIPVIAGAGSNDTNHAIDLSMYCQSVGADGVLSVSPYYNKTSQNGLYEHFKAIANSIDIPIVLYNVPTRTSINIDPQTIARLAEIKNISAVKECNFAQLLETKAICPDDFYFYTGNDDSIVPTLSLGGIGVISVIANIIPNKTSKIVKDYLSGDVINSMNAQIELFDLIKAIFSDVNPIPIKEAMNQMGINVGNCRLPLVEMSSQGKENISKVLKKYMLI